MWSFLECVLGSIWHLFVSLEIFGGTTAERIEATVELLTCLSGVIVT